MNYRRCVLLFVSAACCQAFAAAEDLPPIPPIARVLPLEGIEIPADVRQRLEERLQRTKDRLLDPQVKEIEAKNVDDRLRWRDRTADVEIFIKAVELAIRHREFYTPKDFDKAYWALDEANKRLDSLERDQAPWERQTGLVVLGYRSEIDGSPQPYGLVIPQDHDFAKPCPLYVWLHGRGDKNTDLHFLYERATKVGQISPQGAIVLHPFGRHCVGFKHAGEVDVDEAQTAVMMRYEVDGATALMGFSMGGAGAWHIGAHQGGLYQIVCPGAGFAETARYQRLSPDKYPPSFEQKLWGLYDAPNYVRNLFNTEVIAYSGELDKQRQAAEVMEEAFSSEGRMLTHLVGPGVEHKYEPRTLELILKRVQEKLAEPPHDTTEEVFLQTRTLRYWIEGWVSVAELEEHWQDSRVDGKIVDPRLVRVNTKNVARLNLSPFPDMRGSVVEIDGQRVEIKSARAAPREPMAKYPSSEAYLVKDAGRWREDEIEERKHHCKSIHVHGPIDDAFMDEFVVVLPTGKSRNPRFQQWCEFEAKHFVDRWRSLMRAEPNAMIDTEFLDLHSVEVVSTNLVLWGDPDSNSVIRAMLPRLPVKFSGGKWVFGDLSYDGNQFTPVMIFPADEHEISSAIVLNSGLTFREGHDRTNSLQNPKLPDWAIIDMTQPPDAFAPGRIHDAGFFDEKWQLKNQPKGP